MKTFKLNANKHYQILERGGNIHILEYGDDCPAMKDGALPYIPDSGKIIVSMPPNEEFLIKMGAAFLHAKIPLSESGDQIFCGDDIMYRPWVFLPGRPK